MGSSSGYCRGWTVKLVVLEPGVEDVAAASGEADEGGVAFLAFGSFAVVIRAAGGVAHGSQRREVRLSLRLLGRARCLRADRGP